MEADEVKILTEQKRKCMSEWEEAGGETRRWSDVVRDEVKKDSGPRGIGGHRTLLRPQYPIR